MSSTSTSDTQTQPSAPAQEARERSICIRSVVTSVVLGTLVFLACYFGHHHNWAWGFLIGGFLSLFSMVTLMLAVPFLTWSGAPRHMSGLLVVTLYMKIPIFCMGLYLMSRLPNVSPIACFIGICLTPAVITMKAVGNVITDSEWFRQAQLDAAAEVQQAKSEAVTTQPSLKPAPKVTPKLVPDQG